MGVNALSHRKVQIKTITHEKSVAEVAEIVDAPEKTVKTRMFYARKRLSELVCTEDLIRIDYVTESPNVSAG